MKRLLRQKRLAEAEAYTDHVLDQMVDVLETQRVDYLATTPVLLLLLCRRAPKTVAALSGVRLSGTQITPQAYREFRDALDENAVLLRRYGNTMADPGFGTDAASHGDLLPYRLNYPYTTIQVVDSDDWRRVLDHGQYGPVLPNVSPAANWTVVPGQRCARESRCPVMPRIPVVKPNALTCGNALPCG